MAHRVFYSFHYDKDNWRAAQVRNIRAIEGNQPLSDNDWEKVKSKGRAAIEQWIDDQMRSRSCVIVLIGAETAGRPWIEYEIEKAWTEKRGLLGVRIHRLLDRDSKPSAKGLNPFRNIKIDGVALESKVDVHDPPYAASTDVYKYISDHLERWVDLAIIQRLSR